MVSILSLTENISLSHIGPFFLSQKNTEEQNTQRSTETLSQPITQTLQPSLAVTLCDLCMPKAFCSLTPSPSPNGEGSDYRDTPVCPQDV